MNRRIGSVGIAIASCMVISASRAEAPPMVWSPDAQLLPKLSTVVNAGAYQIQPPKGYELQTRPGPSGSLGRAWVSPPRADGTRHYLMLVMAQIPASDATAYTLDQVATKMLAGVKRLRSDWKQSQPQVGAINGMSFVRTYWKGVDMASGLSMEGFAYVAMDGNTVVDLTSQDVEAYWNDTKSIAEASALTLRKVEAAPAKRIGAP